MAEKVQQRLEKRLPELEDFICKSLFSQEELNFIIKRRRAFEFAIARHSAKKVDYLRYIEYEINLEKLRQKRKARPNSLTFRPKASVSDYSVVKHIHHLFQKALFKFKGDVLLWLQYIDFSQSQSSNRRLTQIFADALRLHPTNEVLWIQAATWEFSTNYNTQAARNLFQRALRLNPKSQVLWHEYFRLELKFTEKIKLRRKLLLNRSSDPGYAQGEDSRSEGDEAEAADYISFGDAQVQGLAENDPILTGALAQAVYRNAIEEIPYNIEFRCKFLEIYAMFTGNVEGIDLVHSSMAADFPGDARVVDLTIRRPLKRYPLGSKEYISALEGCVAKYEEALASSFSSRLVLFYAEFLRDCLDENQDEALKTYLGLKLRGALSDARKRANADSDIQLHPELYEFYIVALKDRFSKLSRAREVAEEATAVHPDAVSLWRLLLSLVPEEEYETRVSTLEAALNHCCSSVDLWTSYFEAHLGPIGNSAPVTHPVNEKFFLDSLRRLGSLSAQNEEEKDKRDRARDVILQHLLFWAFRTSGISYVRTLAAKVAAVACLSVDFYRQWIRLELAHYYDNPHGDKSAPKDQAMLDAFRSLFGQRQAQIASDTLKRVIALYESMVALLPNDLAIWLEYLAFVYNAGSPHQGSALLSRARSLLGPLAYSQLERDYIDYQDHRALESK
ncbi:U3 snoRNP protein [Massospora cicadina]|nr:U3 snoRNP protein [Massospora cicadina]